MGGAGGGEARLAVDSDVHKPGFGSAQLPQVAIWNLQWIIINLGGSQSQARAGSSEGIG